MPPIDDLPAPPNARKTSSIDDLPPPPRKQGPSVGESSLRQLASGVTAGFDDELSGVIGGAGRLVGVKNLGSWKPLDPESHLEMASEPISGDEILSAYRDNRDFIRDEQKKDFDTNPKASLAANVVGSIISPASKIKAARAIGPMTKGQTVVNAAKTAAMQGAVFGAGMSDADLTKGEVGQFAKDVAGSAALSGVIPPALLATKKVAQGVAGVAKWTGKHAFGNALGVSGANISKYWAGSERINAAKSLGEIKNMVDDGVGKLRDDLDQGKITEKESKEALAAMKDQVTKGLGDKKLDAKEALRTADELFKGARERTLAPIKATPAPTHRASDASKMVGELKQLAISESGRALENVKNAGTVVKMEPIYAKARATASKIRSQGTKQAHAIADEVEAWVKLQIDEVGNTASADEAKARILGLDDITEYGISAGAFEKAKNRAFKGIRGEFDDGLKGSSDAYRKEMVPVAEKFKLLERADEAFGTPEGAVGRLGRLNTPRGEFDRATLGELEKAVGKVGSVTKEADEFAKAQSILKDPHAVRQIEQSLPEYQALRQRMADVAKRNPKWTREQVEQATLKQRKALAAATAKRIFAERRLEPYKGLRPDATQSKIESVMGTKKNIANSEAIGRLGKETGNDFLQMADDLSVKEAFNKPYFNGARNTVLWGIMGSLFGGVAGGAIGGNVGHMVDRYGPKVAKKIMDGMMSIRDAPSVQKIRALDLPPNVKSELEREFRVFMTTGKAAEERAVPKVADADRDQNRKPAAPAKYYDGGLVRQSDDDHVKTEGNQKARNAIASAFGGTPQPVKKSEGGVIPGRAKVAGDSEVNDTVPLLGSPGEFIIPREIMMSDDPASAAADFIRQELAKEDGSKRDAPAKGEAKWAQDGAKKLGLDISSLPQEAHHLLVEASDLTVGSKRMNAIKEQIKKGWSQ